LPMQVSRVISGFQLANDVDALRGEVREEFILRDSK